MSGAPEDDVAIDDLRAFVTIVEEGSLNAAAQHLRQPKSTVSRRIGRLEQRLGARVLNRSPRGLVPTETGRALFEPAKAILESVADLAELAREGMTQPRGRLRVTAPFDLGGMPIWMEFAERYPEVDLELQLTNRYVDVVAENFDVALRGGRGENPALIVRRLGSYPLRAVASPRWVERNAPLPPEPDLRTLDCVLLAPFRPTGKGASRTAPKDRRFRHVIVNDPSTVLDGALRGIGAAFLPDHLCQAHLAAGRLVVVHAAYDPREVPLYAAYPDRRYLPAALTALLDLFADELGPAASASARSEPA